MGGARELCEASDPRESKEGFLREEELVLAVTNYPQTQWFKTFIRTSEKAQQGKAFATQAVGLEFHSPGPSKGRRRH